MLQTSNVTSEPIAALRFIPNKSDSTLGTLRVWFRSRAVWDYLDVPATQYFTMRYAPYSVGALYNQAIKGKYHSVKRIGYRVRKEF